MIYRDLADRIASGVLLAQPECRPFRGEAWYEAVLIAVEASLFALDARASSRGFDRACDRFAGVDSHTVVTASPTASEPSQSASTSR